MCADIYIHTISVWFIYIALNCVVEILKEFTTVWNKELIKENMNESSPKKVSPEFDLEGIVGNS